MQHLEKIRAEIDRGTLFVINHSGGKDSQAMTALLADILPPEQVLVVHAVLPEADWDGIPEHIESTLPEGWNVEYCEAIHNDGRQKTFFSLVEHRFAKDPTVPCFPSPDLRTCTSDLKRGPIEKVVKRYLREHPEHGGRSVFIDGRRAEESAKRKYGLATKAQAKKKIVVTWARRKRMELAGRVCFDWLPIHSLTEQQVRAVVADAGQRLHWAYDAGMSRLSCCFCIMASKSDLRTAARLRPELAQRYVELEERTGYTMSMQKIPLAEIIAGATDEAA